MFELYPTSSTQLKFVYHQVSLVAVYCAWLQLYVYMPSNIHRQVDVNEILYLHHDVTCFQGRCDVYTK